MPLRRNRQHERLHKPMKAVQFREDGTSQVYDLHPPDLWHDMKRAMWLSMAKTIGVLLALTFVVLSLAALSYLIVRHG